MKTNAAKRRMLAGEPALGLVLETGSSLAATALGRAGFDFLLVDNQHGDWDDQRSLGAFQGISLGAAVPMAHVRGNDFYAIGRLLDRARWASSCRWSTQAPKRRPRRSPCATRPAAAARSGPRWPASMGPTTRDGSTRRSSSRCRSRRPRGSPAPRRSWPFNGVDGCWIGPSDLGRSLGVDLRTPEGAALHEKAILTVRDACRRAGKIPGIYCFDLADAGRWLRHGFQFVTVGTDTDLLVAGSAAILRELGH